MTDVYEFRVAGRLSAELLETFHPLEAHTSAEETVFSCAIADEGQFFGVIARCELLGLHLIALQQIARPAPPQLSA